MSNDDFPRLELVYTVQASFVFVLPEKSRHGCARCPNSDLLGPGFPATLGTLYVPERIAAATHSSTSRGCSRVRTHVTIFRQGVHLDLSACDSLCSLASARPSTLIYPLY